MKLLLFKKPNCMPCDMVRRHIDGKIYDIPHEIFSVEDETGMKAAAKYGIMSVPCAVVINGNGNVVEKVQGYKPQELDKVIGLVKEG